jgi:predicted  nucleic acid-binding Zn-ribbon protein
MEQVEVYMLKNDSTGGLRYSAGYIYSMDKHVAERLKRDGIAKEINYQSLNAHRSSVSKTVEELQQEIEKIENNKRLTDDAKREDTQRVIQTYEEKVNELQAKYNKDLETLKDAAKKNASTFETEENFDADKVRQHAGMIRSEVEMAVSLTRSAEAIQEQLTFMDKGTARELLAQFTDIKRSMEEKGTAANISAPLINKTVRNVYDGLKKAAEDSTQVSASAEYNLLRAVQDYRGDITGPFHTFKRRMQ